MLFDGADEQDIAKTLQNHEHHKNDAVEEWDQS
jgi:hypothetical protein